MADDSVVANLPRHCIASTDIRLRRRGLSFDLQSIDFRNDFVLRRLPNLTDCNQVFAVLMSTLRSTRAHLVPLNLSNTSMIRIGHARSG